MCALECFHSYLAKGVSICEIAGGAARGSFFLVKHQVKLGHIFDAIAGFDMTNKVESYACMRYRAS
jgi:predicted GNAT superfamily acetyltransferase